MMLYIFIFFCIVCILLFSITQEKQLLLRFHIFYISRIALTFTLDGLLLSTIRNASDAAKEGKEKTLKVLFKMRNACWNESLAKEVRDFFEELLNFCIFFVDFLHHRSGSIYIDEVFLWIFYFRLETHF